MSDTSSSFASGSSPGANVGSRAWFGAGHACPCNPVTGAKFAPPFEKPARAGTTPVPTRPGGGPVEVTLHSNGIGSAAAPGRVERGLRHHCGGLGAGCGRRDDPGDPDPGGP